MCLFVRLRACLFVWAAGVSACVCVCLRVLVCLFVWLSAYLLVCLLGCLFAWLMN